MHQVQKSFRTKYTEWKNDCMSMMCLNKRFFVRKNFYENEAQMAKILKKNEAQFLKLSVFVGQKSMFRHYCI